MGKGADTPGHNGQDGHGVAAGQADTGLSGTLGACVQAIGATTAIVTAMWLIHLMIGCIGWSRKWESVDSGVWIIFLEAGVALALLVFIVWWTMPRRKPENCKDQEDPRGRVVDQPDQKGKKDQQDQKN